GDPFAISAPDGTGMVTFTPSHTVVLSAVGGDDNCTVEFSFDVLGAPTIDVSGASGVQTASSVLVLGEIQTPLIVDARGQGVDIVAVNKVLPAISTVASGPVEAGGQLSDTATLSGGIAPTGTMTFRLFGPDDASCTTAV